jgi:hypothetical protein
MIEELHCTSESFFSAPAKIKKIFSSAALLWPAVGKTKSVKDATQEDDPLR